MELLNVLNIVVCDDSKQENEFITNFIKDHVSMENYDMKVIFGATMPNEVLSYILNKRNANPTMYFLDIDLKANLTGIQLARQIRELDPLSAIVFITMHAELMSLTFEYMVEAMGYIVKGNDEIVKNKIAQYLYRANEKFNLAFEAKEKFTVKTDGKLITEEYDEILFFRIAAKRNKKVIMHCKKRTVEFSGTLIEVEKQNSKLFKCDRSTVVNTSNIATVDSLNKIIHFVNGDTCSASARGMKELENLMNK